MTTTELIKVLTQNEKGGISHKSREISLTINGEYMPNPQITLSSTGDGVCGPEIDLDVDGDFLKEGWIPVSERLPKDKTYVLTSIHVPGRYPHTRSGWYENGLFMNDNGDTWKSSDCEVKAWQPLPKPYSEAEE